jgi:hypothetical protein
MKTSFAMSCVIQGNNIHCTPTELNNKQGVMQPQGFHPVVRNKNTPPALNLYLEVPQIPQQ